MPALPLDTPVDFPFSLGDNGSLKLVFDVFNVTNSPFIRTVNQDIDIGFQAGADPLSAAEPRSSVHSMVDSRF